MTPADIQPTQATQPALHYGLYGVARTAIAYDQALTRGAVLRVYLACVGAGAWRDWIPINAHALANEIKLGVSTVYAALHTLVAHGYLDRQKTGRACLYHAS